MKLEDLKNKMQPNEIEWRVQNVTKDKSKTVIVPYINNRCVMNRFDAVCGVNNWKNTFTEWRGKGVLAGIGIKIGDEWIFKYDGADETGIESTKGGFSDSMKRTAVQWGIGRDLYDYPKVMLKGEIRFIPDATILRLNSMVDKINEGTFKDKLVIL
jgi:hypothetical protein